MSKNSVDKILSEIEKDILSLVKVDPEYNYSLEYFNFHKQRYSYILELIRKISLTERSKILDIGASPYHLSMALSKMGFSVEAINLNKDKMEVATESQFGVRIQPVDLTAGRLPYAKNYFDGILFSETIEHLNFNQIDLFQEFLRIIKPGGKIILTTPNLSRLNNRLKLLIGRSINFDIEKAFYPYIHFREYTAQELVYIFKQAGFNILKVIFTNFSYPNISNFIKIIDKVVGSISRSTRSNIVIIAEKKL